MLINWQPGARVNQRCVDTRRESTRTQNPTVEIRDASNVSIYVFTFFHFTALELPAEFVQTFSFQECVQSTNLTFETSLRFAFCNEQTAALTCRLFLLVMRCRVDEYFTAIINCGRPHELSHLIGRRGRICSCSDSETDNTAQHRQMSALGTGGSASE